MNHLRMGERAGVAFKPTENEPSGMTGNGRYSGLLDENWTGKCRNCDWEHADLGSIGVSAEARVHLHNVENKHTVEVYRDGDLMETIETAHDTGDTYLPQDALTLKGRDNQQERIAREVADPE